VFVFAIIIYLNEMMNYWKNCVLLLTLILI